MNYYIGVGRLTKNPEIKTLEDGKKVAVLSIAINRSYKNKEGVYETDFIDCSVWDMIAEKVYDYCKKGDVISIKGRLESYYEEKDNKKEKKYRIQGEQVSFIQSRSHFKDSEIEEELNA